MDYFRILLNVDGSHRPGCSVGFLRSVLCIGIALFLLFPPRLHAENASPAPAVSSLQTSTAADPIFVQGYVTGKYVFRTTRLNDEKLRDEDIYTDLRLDLSRPFSNKYEFHFFGTLREDLSSDRNRNDFSPFEDIGDTYSSGLHGYLFEAHFDLNDPLARVSRFRLGRQDSGRGEPVLFDGASADFLLSPSIGVTAYGGAAVRQYSFDSPWHSHFLQGLGLDVAPTSASRVGIDYLHTDDARDLFETESHHDQLLTFGLTYRFSPFFRTAAKVKYVNGGPRDASLRLAATLPDRGCDATVNYTRQFRVQNELSSEASPLFEVLGRSNPYQSYDVKFRKAFGPRVFLDLGYFQRSLIDSSQENALNHAFSRTYAVLGLNDIFINRLSLSLTDEEWKSGPQFYNSTGIDAGYALKPGRRSLKFNVGSYYSLYKYDYYISLGERTMVRTYYGKFEYPFAARFTLNCGCEFEQGPEKYQTAKLSIRYDF
jgi:hypothetical protein